MFFLNNIEENGKSAVKGVKSLRINSKLEQIASLNDLTTKATPTENKLFSVGVAFVFILNLQNHPSMANAARTRGRRQWRRPAAKR